MTDTTTKTETTEELERLNAFELARMADIASPDEFDSVGAQFLLSVRDSFIEYIIDNDGEPSEDMAHEVADLAVPIYTHERWLTFVDLAAYQEDVEELVTDDVRDMTQRAGVALYLIAERLVFALIEEMEA